VAQRRPGTGSRRLSSSEGWRRDEEETHAARTAALHVVDLERARDRVAAAERRIENDRSGNPNRGRVKRAQLELSVIESQLRLRACLRDEPSPTGEKRTCHNGANDSNLGHPRSVKFANCCR
jgi:hypothetical protein